MTKIIAAHWLIDMIGAGSWACIMGVCKNPDHNHGRLFRWIGAHPWLAQSVVAIPVAVATVILIDRMMHTH